jgi:hypothetical protein
MTPQQKKLLLPLIILAIGFVSLVGVALFVGGLIALVHWIVP